MKQLNRELIALSALLAVGGAAFSGQNIPTPTPANQVPIAVPREEVESHRAGRQAILRADLGARRIAELAFQGLTVKVIVNSEGVVSFAKAQAQDAPPRLLSQAETIVAKLHYQPFERGGHAVWASFDEHVAILPEELKPWWHTRFPEIHDWNAVVVKLMRTTCLGTCPSYQVEVHGDGTVLYQGNAYVAFSGKHECTISQDKVRELVNAFRQADYYSLRDEYVWGATDLPTYISSIEIDGHSKKVKDYAGEYVGMPLTVSDVEGSIDRLSEVERWTAGNADTLGCLRHEKWDLKSVEAANALAGVAQFGSLEAVRDLIAAGVPLNGQDSMRGTPLTRAAFRGDVPMLRLLLQGGAGKEDAQGVGAAFAMAARSGKSDAMKLLLDVGATAPFGDSQGRTMLMTAAASGVPSIVGEVLRGHPNVNSRDKDGRTALMEAVGQWHYGHEPSEIKRAEVARLLLQAGADPNARDNDGNTALIEAAWDADAVRELVRGGADVNAQNNAGVSALINCAAPDVVRELLANGADASIRDKRGRTALDEAKHYGMKDKEAALSKR
jgi:ankyrin repeat protein